MKKKTVLILVFIVGIAMFLVAGRYRLYYGGGIEVQLVSKRSFSFQDTIVNLDDLIGMPRMAMAERHTAVKRQLEEMDIIDTDEELLKNVTRSAMETLKNESDAEKNMLAARADILGGIALALDLYESDTGGIPTTEQGLQALVAPPAGVANRWKGEYLKIWPVLDPWGRTYRYMAPGKHGDKYDLFSLGKDGVAETDDDITSWK